jgi:hypothetical protein
MHAQLLLCVQDTDWCVLLHEQTLDEEMRSLEEDARLNLQALRAEVQALQQRFGHFKEEEHSSPAVSGDGLDPAQQAFLQGMMAEL